MQATAVRRGLYLERFLVAFASGLFLSLPLYFRDMGRNEVFFAEVYATGAVGTLAVIAVGVPCLRRWGLVRLAPVGCGVYALGCLVYVLADSVGGLLPFYFVASLMQGMGWGLVFTFGPICLSSVVSDGQRTQIFTEYAAFSTLGVGLGPLAAALLHDWGLSHSTVFGVGLVSSAMAFMVALRVARGTQAYGSIRLETGHQGIREIKTIMTQPGSLFLVLVFLGACVYTAMINLQTTYAESVGQAYVLFYGAYSVAVVLARLLLAKALAKHSPARACKGLIGLMAIALLMMTVRPLTAPIYILAAMTLGVAYGLLYPLIQAQCAQHTEPVYRPQVMVYFSLSYFVAVYLFPLLVAHVAVGWGYTPVLLILLGVVTVQWGLAARFYAVKRSAA